MEAGMFRKAVMIGTALLIAGCSGPDDAERMKNLLEYVSENRAGRASDSWVEMKNLYGEWERVGLIFGYADDFDECTKAIAGLKKVNYAREYRCTLAN